MNEKFEKIQQDAQANCLTLSVNRNNYTYQLFNNITNEMVFESKNIDMIKNAIAEQEKSIVSLSPLAPNEKEMFNVLRADNYNSFDIIANILQGNIQADDFPNINIENFEYGLGQGYEEQYFGDCVRERTQDVSHTQDNHSLSSQLKEQFGSITDSNRVSLASKIAQARTQYQSQFQNQNSYSKSQPSGKDER